MAIRRLTATAALAAPTVIVSLVLTALAREGEAGAYAGFIPARASGYTVIGAEHALPAWITPLSATLVHAGPIHLLFNMVMLVFAGRACERALGGNGMLLLYVVGAYAAAGAQWLADPVSTMPMVGASGAISALMGAYALLYSQPRNASLGPIPARLIHVLWLALAWTGVNLLLAFVSRHAGIPIAAAAHTGGFVIGLALARPLLWLHWRKA